MSLIKIIFIRIKQTRVLRISNKNPLIFYLSQKFHFNLIRKKITKNHPFFSNIIYPILSYYFFFNSFEMNAIYYHYTFNLFFINISIDIHLCNVTHVDMIFSIKFKKYEYFIISTTFAQKIPLFVSIHMFAQVSFSCVCLLIGLFCVPIKFTWDSHVFDLLFVHSWDTKFTCSFFSIFF